METHELDITGNPVLRSCENCEGLYDDSDGIEYGPPYYRCSRKPHMENLRGFPFATPQRCFDLHWSHLLDWDTEGRKLDAASPAEPAAAMGGES